MVFALAGVLGGGVAQAQLDDVLAVGLATAQAGLELGGGNVDVDVGVGAADDGIIAGADGGGDPGKGLPQ